MKKMPKQISLFLLIIQLLLSNHVDFCLEHSNSCGGQRITMSQVEVIQESRIIHKCMLEKECLASEIILYTYNTIQKDCNHNIYAKKIIIHRKIGEKQLARKDLSGDDSVPLYGYENMI